MGEVRLLSLGTLKKIKEEIQRVGVDEACLDSLGKKGKFLIIKISGVGPAPCNIIKQTAISVGTDAAVHREVITGRIGDSDVILFGSVREIERVAEKLRNQPFGLNEISEKLVFLIDGKREKRYLRTSQRKLELDGSVRIMGILNVTPDSFSDGGKFLEPERAVERALGMVDEGAHIIDVGGESSRPGAEPVSPEEEVRRVIPVIEKIKRSTDIPISIDTYKSIVAEKAIESGAEIVNDISAFRFNPEMVTLAREKNTAVVVMHMQGTPQNMQDDPHYDDVIQEIYDFIKERVHYLRDSGIGEDQIIVDPGIGFGKRYEDNLDILSRVREFKSLGYPVLIGPSRKSFIGHTLDLPIHERLEGSLAACALALEGGVNIVRVHDVKETKRFIDMYRSIKRREL
jgi:dihydropteroate synthase